MKKKVLSLILSVVMLSSVFGAGLVEAMAANTDVIDVWNEDWREQVFQNDSKSASQTADISLCTAKNEYEPTQLVLRSKQAFKINEVVFSDLTSEVGNISAANAAYHFVGYYKLNSNTKGISNPVLQAPGYFPEKLLNDKSMDVAANTTEPIWIKYYIPKETVPGLYKGNVTVKTDLGDFIAPIEITVNNVTLPDSEDAAFKMEFWNDYVKQSRNRYNPMDDVIKEAYGIAAYTDEWWALMEKFAAFNKEYRLNVLYVNIMDLLADAPGTRYDDSGEIVFDFSLMDRYIELFMEKGGVDQLSASHLCEQSKNGAGTLGFNVKVLNKSKTGVSKGVATITNGGRAYLEQYLPALSAHLAEKGWADIWYQHIGDEPTSGNMPTDYKVISKLVKDLCPGIRTGDAMYSDNAAEFTGSMDRWIPAINLYDESKELKNWYDARQAQGDELWYYTALSPRGHYLNRFIDMQVYRSELIGWLAYQNDVTGFLHWGLMTWNIYEPLDENEALGAHNAQYPGDSYSIYPDTKNNAIISSIRMEAMREASEQYDLLVLYGKKDEAAAKALSKTLVKNSGIYTEEAGKIYDTRNQLLHLAADPYIPPQTTESEPTTTVSDSATMVTTTTLSETTTTAETTVILPVTSTTTASSVTTTTTAETTTISASFTSATTVSAVTTTTSASVTTTKQTTTTTQTATATTVPTEPPIITATTTEPPQTASTDSSSTDADFKKDNPNTSDDSFGPAIFLFIASLGLVSSGFVRKRVKRD